MDDVTTRKPHLAFFGRLRDLQTRWDVLAHPFYLRWSAGELSLADLRRYAGEYEHAVVALAATAARAADLAPEHRAHADEERMHIDLWRDFRRALGGDDDRPEDPAEETVACARAWTGDDPSRGLPETLVVLYAIESMQPRVARSKLQGLRRYYGITDRAATAYFHVHAVRDHEHARAAAQALAPLLAGSDMESLLGCAEHALAGQWHLLSGVDRAAAGTEA